MPLVWGNGRPENPPPTKGPCIDFFKATVYYISIYAIIMITLGFTITHFFSLISYYAALLTARDENYMIVIPGLLTALCVGFAVMVGEPLIIVILREYDVELADDYAGYMIIWMLLENLVVVMGVAIGEWWMGRLC